MDIRWFTMCFLVCFLTNAQSFSTEDGLAEFIDAWRVTNDIQGISISIYDNKKIQTVVSGYRSQDQDTILKDDSFMVGSLTKTFVAAAILELKNKGILRLNESAVKFCDLDIPEQITVSELLYHEAGLPEYFGNALTFETFIKEHENGRTRWNSNEVRVFAGQNPVAENARFNYSNSHYVVLGAIIEKQIGRPLHKALHTLIFKPNQLNSARLITEKKDNPEALGRSKGIASIIGDAQISPRLTCELATVGEAAGGVAINSPDLAIWAMNYFSGSLDFKQPKGGNAFGLNSNQIKVGYGAYKVKYKNKWIALHGGDALGSTAMMLFDPQLNKSVAILVNDDKIHSLGFGNEGYLDELALQILEKLG